MNIEDHQKILSECHARHAAELASRDAEIDDLGESLAQVKLKNELLIDERDQLRKDVKMLRDAATRAHRKLSAYVGVCTGDKELTNTIIPMLKEALAATELRS